MAKYKCMMMEKNVIERKERAKLVRSWLGKLRKREYNQVVNEHVE